MPSDVKRRYRQEVRAEQAARTRAAIRDAAASLFLERGFAATTMREVAARAGVGERTLYDAFPTKVALFEHVAGVAIAGGEDQPRVADLPGFRAALAEQDGRRAVAIFARFAAALLERAGPLIMVAVESAGAEEAMRAFDERGAAATRANAAAFAAALHRHGVLAVSRPEATSTVFAVASPHVHAILRRHRGMSATGYRRWLERTLAAALLGQPR